MLEFQQTKGQFQLQQQVQVLLTLAKRAKKLSFKCNGIYNSIYSILAQPSLCLSIYKSYNNNAQGMEESV